MENVTTTLIKDAHYVKTILRTIEHSDRVAFWDRFTGTIPAIKGLALFAMETMPWRT